MNDHPSTESRADKARRLGAKLLRKRLFVMLRLPLDSSLAPEHFADHLQWVIDAEAQGKVFASGPFVAASATPAQPGSPAGGMTILRAATLAQAQAIADTDPYVRHGVVSYEMREWLLMEGGFTLRLSFAQGSYTLD